MLGGNYNKIGGALFIAGGFILIGAGVFAGTSFFMLCPDKFLGGVAGFGIVVSFTVMGIHYIAKGSSFMHYETNNSLYDFSENTLYVPDLLLSL